MQLLPAVQELLIIMLDDHVITVQVLELGANHGLTLQDVFQLGELLLFEFEMARARRNQGALVDN